MAKESKTKQCVEFFGEVAELANASGLNPEVPKGHGGSRPSFSAKRRSTAKNRISLIKMSWFKPNNVRLAYGALVKQYHTSLSNLSPEGSTRMHRHGLTGFELE